MTERMTPAEAWEGFVGSQTPAEFVAISTARDGITDIDEMCERYAAELPKMFADWDNSADPNEIASLLARYVRASIA